MFAPLTSKVESPKSEVEDQLPAVDCGPATVDLGQSTVELKLARRRRSWIALASGVWLAPVLKRGGTNVA